MTVFPGPAHEVCAILSSIGLVPETAFKAWYCQRSGTKFHKSRANLTASGRHTFAIRSASSAKMLLERLMSVPGSDADEPVGANVHDIEERAVLNHRSAGGHEIDRRDHRSTGRHLETAEHLEPHRRARAGRHGRSGGG